MRKHIARQSQPASFHQSAVDLTPSNSVSCSGSCWLFHPLGYARSHTISVYTLYIKRNHHHPSTCGTRACATRPRKTCTTRHSRHPKCRCAILRVLENANDCAHAVAHRNSRITRKHYQRCMRTQTLEDARNSLQTFALQIYILRRGGGSCCARTCTKTQTSNIFPHSHQCNARPHEKHTTLHARRKRLKKTLGKSACTQYVRRVGVAAAC